MVLVIFTTVLVVMMTKTEQQLTAAIGTLWTVVGCLFGATFRTILETRSAGQEVRPLLWLRLGQLLSSRHPQ